MMRTATWITIAAWAFAQDIVVERPRLDPGIAARRAAYAVERPALRGFRAGILEYAAYEWPIVPPKPDGDPGLAAAAEIVAQRLARDGLLPTLARAIEVIGPTQFLGNDQPDLLRAVGLPTDWLEYFSPPKPPSVAQYVAERLLSGASVGEILPDLERSTFLFRPSLAGFRVATESGEHEPKTVRMQVAAGGYYAGEGDGGSVDLARQLFSALPDAQFVVGIEEKNLATFSALVRGWKPANPARITLLPQTLPLAQWAQDNGKPGIVEQNGQRFVATIVPRYASRGEDGAVFVPGDTFALEAFTATGQRVAQSPLLFQGGDLLPVLDPKTGQRWLIMGEAELCRNTALGLSRAQTLEAFRKEFSVDRCIVLPAVSFHVDYEVSVHALPDGLVACMSDTSAASRLALGCAIGALERNGTLSADGAKLAREDLTANRLDPFMQRLSDVLAPKSAGFGAFPESYAKTFALGASDSGVGNLHRFLLALDALTAEQIGGSKIEELGLDPHLQAYLVSFRQREVDRRTVAEALAREGFRVVGVPSTSESGRSLNTLNGVHTPGRYLMPAYGGLYAEFDAAARKAFEAALPGVKVVPILCGESERREGALHCSVSVIPKL